MSDRVALLNEGELVQVADSLTLYTRPKNRFVASFVGESNLLPCRVDRLHAGEGWVSIAREGKGVAKVSGQREGDEGWLFVRPEHVCLFPRGRQERGPGMLDGVIEQALFMGEMTRYTVRCGDIRVTVKTQNRDGGHFVVEAPVTIAWKGEDAIVLD